MIEMASYQRHVGPWPIKRSQSVPDASVRIFTPCTTPASLAQCLTKVEEDVPPLQLEPAGPSNISIKNDWSNYSMQHAFRDVERDGNSGRQPFLDAIGPHLSTTKLFRTCFTLAALLLTGLVFCMLSFFGHPHERRITLPKHAPSAVWLYCLIWLFTTVVGILMHTASTSLTILVENQLVGTRGMVRMMVVGIVSGTVMTLLWMVFVLPPIVHAIK